MANYLDTAGLTRYDKKIKDWTTTNIDKSKTVSVDESQKMLKVTVGSKTYILNGMKELVKPTAPASSIAETSVDGTQTLYLTSTDGAEIRYTTDGTTPTKESSLYKATSGITLSEDTTQESTKRTVNAKAWLNGEESDETALEFTVYRKVSTPKISVSGDEYDTSRTVTVTCETSGASIKVSKDGTNPSTAYAAWNVTESVAANMIKAQASHANWKTSSVATYANAITVGTLKMYYGVMAGIPSALGDITALTPVKSHEISTSKTATKTKYDFAMSNSRAVFAFPTSVATALTHIYDQNDFDQFGEFTKVFIGDYTVYYKTKVSQDSDTYNFVK